MATFVVATAAPMALAASAKSLNYKTIKNSTKYYHYCKIAGCSHAQNFKHLSLNPEGRWGFVYSNSKDHKDSYKYLSITPYCYNDAEKAYAALTSYAVRAGGTSEVIITSDAIIDKLVAKVVYNGQIFRTGAKSSGILQKYLVGSFRSDLPIQ